MINTCVIGGRLGQDPEIRQTQNGTPCANFNIACERDFKNAEGQRETDWIRCVCFGATADFAGRFLQKGRAVCVDGRLQVRKWTDKDGQKRESAEIVANNVYFTDSPNPNRDNGQTQGGYPPQAAGYQPNNGYQGGGQYGSQPGYGGGYGYQNPGGGYGGRQ